MINYPGNTTLLHLIVPRHTALLREQYAQSKKELQLYCCNLDWTKSDGQIPWNVTAICETWLTVLSDGNTTYELRLCEPFKGPVFPVLQQPNFTKFLFKTSHVYVFIISGRKFCPEYSSDLHLTRKEFWKGGILVADF